MKRNILMVLLLSVFLPVSLVGCDKEETLTCVTLVGYGGNASSDTLTATYSNGYTIQGTKDDLPFDTLICADVWGCDNPLLQNATNPVYSN